MSRISLIDISLDPRCHLSAVRWLWSLYRSPNFFKEELRVNTIWGLVRLGIAFVFHALPGMLLSIFIIRYSLKFIIDHGYLQPFGIIIQVDLPTITYYFSGGMLGAIFGIAFGLIIGIAWNIWAGDGVDELEVFKILSMLGLTSAIVLGTAAGVALGFIGTSAILIIVISQTLILGVIWGILFGVFNGYTLGVAGSLFFSVASGGAGVLAGYVTSGSNFGWAFGIACLVFTGVGITRFYYVAIHFLWIWPTRRPTWFALHPIAWDNAIGISFPYLDLLLAAYADLDTNLAKLEIERLLKYNPSIQQKNALRARVRIAARSMARLTDLRKITALAAQLPSDDDTLFRQTREITEWTAQIANLQVRLNVASRAFLCAPLAKQLLARINEFGRQVTRLKEPFASEFRAAALAWKKVAQQQCDDYDNLLSRQPTPQVFRAGDPVNPEQEAFVPRLQVIERLEEQIMLSNGCPGLILYGRRRMGKTTALRNLSQYLPKTVHLGMLSMQDASAFTSLATFSDAIVHTAARALNELQLPDFVASNTLVGLGSWLHALNGVLLKEQRRLLLALDEYEVIDKKLSEGVFSEDLLALMRESMQQDRQITWVFAGSHEISELKNAEWSSYLVSARLIEVPSFTLDETRLLLTEPMKQSTFWKDREVERPRFSEEFWGNQGIERIQLTTAGWPHLVQLMAETLISEINNAQSPTVTEALYVRAQNEAIIRGDTVLRQLLQNECRLPGEWDYVLGFLMQNTQPPPADPHVHRSLRRRWLVVEENGLWKLRVPLMQLWLRIRS